MSHGPSSQVSYIRNLEAEIFKKCIILGNFQSVVVDIAPKNNQSQAEIVTLFRSYDDGGGDDMMVVVVVVVMMI